MKAFVDAMNGLPLIVKVILAIPLFDIVWVIYRIIKSIANNNTLGVILGVILVIVGIPFLWLIDIITLLLTGKVLWLD